jgi:hypothetical protein
MENDDYIPIILELRIELGITDYNLKQKPTLNWVNLCRVGDLWVVEYYVEDRLELIEHFLTRPAALDEIDRIMEHGEHLKRPIVICGKCSAMYDNRSVGDFCPMCGAWHNGEDFDKYLGWSIYKVKAEEYAEGMAAQWQRHLEWRKNHPSETKE